MSEKSKNSSQGATGDKKRSGPSPSMIAIAAIALGAVVWFWMNGGNTARKGGEETSLDLSGQQDGEALEEGALKNLGKTLVIGPSVEKLAESGTTPVTPRSIAGLDEALDQRDVGIVIDLLEKAGVSHVLIDPSITVRDPIPEATVRNRLALAHPAGRLQATLMSKRFFRYELVKEVLSISPEAKEAMMDIVRATAGATGAEKPERVPAELAKTDEWRAILTVRPVQSAHLVFHSVNASTLAGAAQELGEKMRSYYESKNFARKFGPLPEALDKRLNLELEVVYDEGSFVGPRDDIFMWRIVEPGIHGVRVRIDGKNHQLPPWYSVTANLRTVASIMERIVHKMGGQEKSYWLRDDVVIERYRTIHWRERTPGGPIEDLYRASPRMPTTKDVTRENMKASLVGLNDWLADNANYPDGRMIYRYYPTSDRENLEYNMVRHTLGAFSMALTQEYAPNPKYKQVAEQCMKWIEDRIRWGGAPKNPDGSIDSTSDTWQGKPLPGPDVAIFEADEYMYDPEAKADWANKMGGVAVAILGYTQYKRVGWELSPEREKILDGLAKFLLYMQNDEGSFHHYYVSKDSHYYGVRNSIYPGEILYAVARLYGETRDERFKEAFKASMKANMEWFIKEMEQKEPDGTYVESRRKDLVQFQPWIGMAMEEMYQYDPDPSYVEASNLVSLWVLDTYQFDEKRAFYPDYLGGYMKVLDELPAMHTFVYTEGTAASYVLARRDGTNKEAIDRLRKGVLLSARFILQQQATPGRNDYYYPNPKKAKGGVRYCMNHNKQRIDYTYHALSSVWRILHAATDEDYAFIQSIEMPAEW